jgi:hypothetical protein
MVNQQRIDRFIQLLKTSGKLTGRLDKHSNHIEIFSTDDQRLIARRPISDFDDTGIDLITLIPS